VSLALLEALSVDGLDDALASLRQSPNEAGLGRFFKALYSLPEETLERAIASAVASAKRVSAALDRGEAAPFPLSTSERALVLTWLPRIAALHPRDAGVIGALLLNAVELAPGEAIYLPAGNLHAYLSGTALEIMASSDNVLRGGLTPKHVDVPELLRILSFAPHAPAILKPKETRGRSTSERVYDAPVAEFQLSVIELDAGSAREPWHGGTGPEILLCLSGKLLVTRGSTSLELTRGQSIFCAAADAPYALSGSGRVARARAGV
jgi:mannose-6-phosphate isomerase